MATSTTGTGNDSFTTTAYAAANAYANAYAAANAFAFKGETQC